MEKAQTAASSGALAPHEPRHKSSDFLAAITGMIVGGCVLFALVFGIVELTNHMYAGESAPEASPATAATTGRASAPSATVVEPTTAPPAPAR